MTSRDLRETAGVKLETSGSVYVPGVDPDALDFERFFWTDLDPFTQGYIEALLSTSRSELHQPCDADPEQAHDAGFSDFAGETLAAILKDCDPERRPHGQQAEHGRLYWRNRQTGMFADYAPPLTVYLGDDGKVRIAKAGASQ